MIPCVLSLPQSWLMKRQPRQFRASQREGRQPSEWDRNEDFVNNGGQEGPTHSWQVSPPPRGLDIALQIWRLQSHKSPKLGSHLIQHSMEGRSQYSCLKSYEELAKNVHPQDWRNDSTVKAHVQLLQMACVQFLAFTLAGSQPPITSAPGILCPLTASSGTCMHTHIFHTKIDTHKFFN